MFTASLNLEALQKSIKTPLRICAMDGCEQTLPPAPSDAQFCSDHSKQQAERPRRTKKARR